MARNAEHPRSRPLIGSSGVGVRCDPASASRGGRRGIHDDEPERAPYDTLLHRFPRGGPAGPAWRAIDDDPPFDPVRHLALGEPERHLTLDELGYGPTLEHPSPTRTAATSCFRILSEEGVAAMQHVCAQLEAFTTANPRIARNTRGGVYRSAFLRDFALSAEVTGHLSRLLDAELVPHAMGHQLCHLNYAPPTVGEDVDKWHHDTLQVDYVMFVTDPNAVEGGEFQYFLGTREEMRALHAAGAPIPPERIVAPTLPGAGHAVLMQGNYVVHQAKGLRAPGERITLVNGYSFADPDIPDYTAWKQLLLVDPPEAVLAEYTRQTALRCVDHLRTSINRPDYAAPRERHVETLRRARAELDATIAQLEDGTTEDMAHFGS